MIKQREHSPALGDERLYRGAVAYLWLSSQDRDQIVIGWYGKCVRARLLFPEGNEPRNNPV